MIEKIGSSLKEIYDSGFLYRNVYKIMLALYLVALLSIVSLSQTYSSCPKDQERAMSNHDLGLYFKDEVTVAWPK